MPAVQAKNNPTGPQQSGFKPKSEKKDFPPIPTGIYDVEVTRVQYRNKNQELANGGFWGEWKAYEDEVNFGFRVTNGDYKNRWFFVDAEFAFDHGSKLRSIVQAITGFNPLPEDYVFDTDDEDDYIGLDCRLRIVRKPNKKGVEVNYVQEVLPAENLNSSFQDADSIF